MSIRTGIVDLRCRYLNWFCSTDLETPGHLPYYLRMENTAIIAEGGGQRGIYTAGVLDAFLHFGFNPFTMGIGVSAGAQNLFSYFLEQPGYARRAIEELTREPGFFVPYRWVGERGIIDLDGYFAHSLNDPDYLLPFQRITKVQTQRRLYFVATDLESLEPVYLEPDESNVVEYLKASSAVPFLYKSGVSFGGRTLLDGGIADPIPVKRAIDLGAKRMIVIRTTSQGAEPGWRHRLEQFRKLRALPARMIRMLERHERAEHEAESLIENHDKDIELVMIKPEIPLKSQVFGSRSEDLVTDYKVGWYDGAQAIAGLGHWQATDSAVDRSASKAADGVANRTTTNRATNKVADKADEHGAVEPAEDTALLS